jgi:hypothetical protein
VVDAGGQPGYRRGWHQQQLMFRNQFINAISKLSVSLPQ